MAVLESQPNELNTCSSATPYGCKDRKMLPGYYMPVRQYHRDGSGNFDIVTKFILHRMSTECRYDKSTTDPRCGACKHRHTAEQYDKMIRKEGK